MNASGVPEKHAGLSLKKMTNGATFAPLAQIFASPEGESQAARQVAFPGRGAKDTPKTLLRGIFAEGPGRGANEAAKTLPAGDDRPLPQARGSPAHKTPRERNKRHAKSALPARSDRPRMLPRALPEASKTGRLGRSPHAEQGNSAVRQAKKESPCPPPPQKTPAENEYGERPPANAKPPPGNIPRKRRKNERPGPRSSRLRRAGRRAGTAPGAAQTTRAPSLPARRRGNVTLPAGRASADHPPRRARPARQKDAFRRDGLRAVRPRRAQIPAAKSRRHPARASARSPRPCR